MALDLELAEQPVADDLQVQLAHAGDDELAGFLVGEAAEGRVFLRQALQALAHLVAVRLGLGLDGHRDDRLGEGRRLEQDFEVLVAQRVAGGDVPQPDQRGDVAGRNVVSTSMRLSAWIIMTRLTRSRLRVRGL